MRKCKAREELLITRSVHFTDCFLLLQLCSILNLYLIHDWILSTGLCQNNVIFWPLKFELPIGKIVSLYSKMKFDYIVMWLWFFSYNGWLFGVKLILFSWLCWSILFISFRVLIILLCLLYNMIWGCVKISFLERDVRGFCSIWSNWLNCFVIGWIFSRWEIRNLMKFLLTFACWLDC